MAKKKDASTGSSDASLLRRSGRETPSRKSERLEKNTSPNPSPVKNILEKVEKPMGSSPLRRSDRGKKSVETTELPNTKSATKDKTSNNSKPSSEEVNEDNETEKHDSVGSSLKRKKPHAIRYKSIFRSQRTRVESNVDKEPKSQNSTRVQGVPEKDNKAVLEVRVIDLDQIQHADRPQTKTPDGKSIESGNVEKSNGVDVSPSSGNIANSDNHILQTSPHRIEHDLENPENNNMQNSKFVEFWVPVHISNVQLEQYCATLLSNDILLSSSKSDKLGALHSIFTTNRMICNHPYTVNRELEASLTKDQSMIVNVGKEISGKFRFLDHILPEIQKRQLRVLILFQPTIVGPERFFSLGRILADFIYRRIGHDSYVLVDGIPNISSKKEAAMFNKDPTRFIFLIESRACHQSVKLSSVDAIIIFDSETNPSNDLKSLQKLSIDSPLDQIMIFRLYCSSTLEEKILKLAENNVTIDIRSSSLRSNYDCLLTWGASDLFDRLTKFHSQTGLNMSSDESFLKDVVNEFIYILSHKCKSNDTSLKLISTRILNRGIYGKSSSLHSEVKTHLPDGDQAYMFWKNLLEGRSPVWKFVSESTPRQRKRRNVFLDSPATVESGADGVGGVKMRRKTVNINSTVKPAQLKTVTEEVVAANDESQSSSGDQLWSTETSVLDHMKSTVSKLCDLLKFSEDVKNTVEKFLVFVYCNYQANTDDTSSSHGFMLSLCWICSSIGENKTDRSESFALAKQHLNFICQEKQAEVVYEMLKPLKQTFLEHTQTETKRIKVGIEKSQHVTNVEAVEKINSEWDEKRVSIENDYKIDKNIIIALYNSSLIRSGKLEIKEREFVNNLEELERIKEIRLKELNDISLQGCQDAEVGPTLPEKPVEVQSDGEPVCEGANDIESTGSHEQIGDVPAQQVGDDVEVDVVEKVDPGHEKANEGASSPDAPRAGGDYNETGANDVAPHVDCGDVEMPDGNCNKEIDEDGLAGLDENCHNETGTNDVVPPVNCGDMEVLDGSYDKENDEDDHNETGASDMVPRVGSGGAEMPAGNDHKENDKDEIDHIKTGENDMAPHIDSAVVEMPAGNFNKEASHAAKDCHETVDDVAPAAEMGTTAGTCDKEDAEDGEILPDTPDVLPAEMATTADNENNNASCGSSSYNPVCSATSQDKTPSVQPVSSPPSDHEIQNEPIQHEEPDAVNQHDQIIPDAEPSFPTSTAPMVAETPSGPLFEQILDSGAQDEEVNIVAGQLDQIILDVEPDLTVAENPSNTVPQTEPLLEPVCEEPTPSVSVPASTSVAPAPLVNPLNMFDNLATRVVPQITNQTDPLQAEVERLRTIKENVAKFHQDMKQKLDSDCEKEIAEVIAQIRLKYEAKKQQADSAYDSRNTELETNINRVMMNKILADAFRSKCQDLTPSGHPGLQQASQAEIMQQLRRLPSTMHPGQSSNNHQPPPLPQQRSQPPLQIVHQPAALFSNTPSRPPSPVVNQLTSSRLPPTRLPPIVNRVTPSTTPTTTRPPPGINNSLSASLNRPPGTTPRDMSAANLRISTETCVQSSHTRPLVIGETRAPTAPPHIRPLVIETRAPGPHITRAPSPHLRPFEARAPAPHLRSRASTEIRARAPHMQPFTRSVPPDVGTHRRVLPSQHVPPPPPPPVPQSPPLLVVSDNEMVDITELIGEGTAAQTSSGPDLVCLSDDD